MRMTKAQRAEIKTNLTNLIGKEVRLRFILHADTYMSVTGTLEDIRDDYFNVYGDGHVLGYAHFLLRDVCSVGDNLITIGKIA